MLGPSFCDPEEEREFWGSPCGRIVSNENVESNRASWADIADVYSKRLTFVSIAIEFQYLLESSSLRHLEKLIEDAAEGLSATLSKTFPSTPIVLLKP